MIWKSTVLMTVIDVAILTITILSLATVIKQRSKLITAHTLVGPTVTVIGLTVVGLFYLVDLFTMWILPAVTTPETASAAMEALHLDYSWIIMLGAVTCIFLGFSLTNLHLLKLIEGREQTKQALQQTEERYRQLVDLCPDAIVVRRGQQIVYANSAAAALYGADGVNDLIGRNLVDFAYAPDADEVKQILQAYHRSPDRKLIQYAYRVMTLDGKVREVEASSGPAAGFGSGARQGILRDVTERNRTEEMLRSSEECYRTFIQQITEATVRWELAVPMPIDLPEDDQVQHMIDHLYVAECNNRAVEILGYTSAEQVIGAKARAAVPLFPDTAEPLRAFVRAGYRVHHYETRDRDRRGKLRFLEHNVTGIVEDAMLVRCWSTALDVEERKRAEDELRASEEKFATAFRSSPDMISIATIEDGRLLDVNDAFLRMTGFTREEVIGRTTIELNLWTNPEQRTARLRSLMYTGHVRDLEVDFRMKSGEIRQFSTSAEIIDVAGVPHSLAVTRDITEQKRVDWELRHSRRQLQALSRRLIKAQESERGRVARELHDEIGQALTAIKLNLQSVQRLRSPDSLKRRIGDSIAIVDRTVEEVRNLAVDLRPSLLDDLGLEAALRWYLERQAKRAGINVHVALRAGPNRPRREVETACFRVAQEAFTNVLRHAKAREVKVQLTNDGDSLELVVEDDGIGFDVASAQRSITNHDHLGMVGMGERVELVQGSFDIEAVPGHGTRVVARFPVSSELTATAVT